MKTKIYLLFIVISLLSFLCGCSQQQIYTMTEKTVDEFVTENSVKDKMIVQYTSRYSDEGIEFTHSQAIELYSILNISSCKEIIINKDFDYENLKWNYFNLWFYTDQATFKDTVGMFAIYENDIICYSLSPYTSFTQYVKSPNGTYDAILNKVNDIQSQASTSKIKIVCNKD